MLFAIDIDGTIAGTDHGREYAHYLNRVLGIGISEEKVAAFSSYREFAYSAEVQAFGAVSQGRDTTIDRHCLVTPILSHLSKTVLDTNSSLALFPI